jgi:hypothetical protein
VKKGQPLRGAGLLISGAVIGVPACTAPKWLGKKGQKGKKKKFSKL